MSRTSSPTVTRTPPISSGRTLTRGWRQMPPQVQLVPQEKYDLILQEVVFAGPRVDITEKVIRALNAAPAAAAPGR